MQCPEPFPMLMYATRKLYATAMAELEDSQLLELLANASAAVAQHSKDVEAGDDEVPQCKALLDAAQMACTLYSIYEKRVWRRRLSGGRGIGFNPAGPAPEQAKPDEVRQEGKILPFRAQSDASLVAGSRRSSSA